MFFIFRPFFYLSPSSTPLLTHFLLTDFSPSPVLLSFFFSLPPSFSLFLAALSSHFLFFLFPSCLSSLSYPVPVLRLFPHLPSLSLLRSFTLSPLPSLFCSSSFFFGFFFFPLLVPSTAPPFITPLCFFLFFPLPHSLYICCCSLLFPLFFLFFFSHFSQASLTPLSLSPFALHLSHVVHFLLSLAHCCSLSFFFFSHFSEFAPPPRPDTNGHLQAPPPAPLDVHSLRCARASCWQLCAHTNSEPVSSWLPGSALLPLFLSIPSF